MKNLRTRRPHWQILYIKKKKNYMYFFKLFKKTEEKKIFQTQFMKKALCWSHNQTRISQKKKPDKHLQKYSMKY